MSKIGSSGKPEPNKGPSLTPIEPSDPFEALSNPLQSGSEAPGVSWFSATREVAEDLASYWFGQLPHTTFRQYLTEKGSVDPGARSMLANREKHEPNTLEETVFPGILEGASALGEPVPFSASSLAAKILGFLEQRGIKGEQLAYTAVGGALVGSNAQTFQWYGPWPTAFGTRCYVRIEIRKDPEGTEWAYIHTNLVVASRKLEPVGELHSRYISLPRFIHRQMFIAETPLPSTIRTMNRGSAYPDVPESFWPRPLASLEDFALTSFALGDSPSDSSKVSVKYESFPHVIRAGFGISAQAEEHFDTLIPTVIDATVNLATIAEDGFRNYRSADIPNPFDFLYGSSAVLFENKGLLPNHFAREGKTAGGFARFIPEHLLGPLYLESDRIYDSSHDAALSREHRKQMLEWVASEGVGRPVSGAINSLCYEFLMPERRWHEAELLLRAAIDLDSVEEATNAMCNLGHVFHAKGDWGLAKETLLQALERPDKFAEAEACYYLGLTLAEEGDTEQARSFWDRGAQATHLGSAQQEYATKCQEKLQSASSDRGDSCHQCDQPLQADARFCSRCGSASRHHDN